jgi:hypothetical protein
MVGNTAEKEILSKGIEQSLSEARIPALTDIRIENKSRGFTELLKEVSSDADIVFLGLKNTDAGNEQEHAAKIEELARVGKLAVFVQNNSLKDDFPILLNSGQNDS